MKIIVAADSFKDALPALQVTQAIQRGIQKIDNKIKVQLLPLGDGGEGTAEILTWHSQGSWMEASVHDPLFRSIQAGYGISKNNSTAFIEMASASGLQLLKNDERNCLETSSYGTGELIRNAVKKGAQTIILTLGGSATNDVGIGMAAALGYAFFDEKNQSLRPIGKNIGRIKRIDRTTKIDLETLTFKVLCDVDNPLFGPQGAAHTYAKQKGGDAKGIEILEQGARHFSEVLKNHFGNDYAHEKGAGAAGGMGAGALAFLRAELLSGIDFVLDHIAFEKHLEDADLVITGEGKIDHQSLHGKLISGITKRAGKLGVPVIALCGKLSATQQQIKALGLQAAFCINDKKEPLHQALAKTAERLEFKTAEILPLMLKYL